MRLFLLAGLLALTACSTPDPDQGQASSPGPTTTMTTTTTTTTQETPEPETPEPEVPEVTKKAPVSWSRPCELMDADELVPTRQQFFKVIKDEADTCTWELFLSTHQQYRFYATDHPAVSVADASLDLNTPPAIEEFDLEITVGERKAKRINASSMCAIALPVGHGHVQVGAKTYDGATSCQWALVAAGIIEPKLPA